MKIVQIFLVSLLLCNSSFAGDYPKTKTEKEIESMGSLLDINFKQSQKKKHVRFHARKKQDKKDLYEHSMDVLKFAPIELADKKSGMITTKWHPANDSKTTEVKIIVKINGFRPKSRNIDVKVYERKKLRKDWSAPYNAVTSSNILKNQIISKGRDI